MPDDVLELTDATFRDGVAEGVVLVDFYGTWCPPCKLLEPVIEKLAGEYRGRAVVAGINVDEHSESAVDNSVEDIPTIIVFKGGREAERLYGAQGYETLKGVLDRLLA